eukprot:CAMPEP_0201516808 /NCGR_PEP_ID=MMETSP0161_2-20130828/8063_1 /ASSEMBLY_ACC=CAM_ASM_000251 /TAXON_ID=180227 /ORGANISM="Neoparamoeba aestuarina, Strain SoJaBio B1-5/56/2" /LENGTH=150 /DNA_ID=CAMNT_0047914091 /DNA_START=79 /DNA_END=531 /DNA_ORIENTATION=+
MGAKFSKEAAIALDEPANLQKVCKVFNQLDKDHSGGLSKEEFRVFAKIILEKDVKELGVAYQSEAGGDAGKQLFNEDFGELSQNIKQGDIDEYVDHMYKIADTDGDNNMTFDEFRNFLKTHRTNRYDSTGLKDSRGFGTSFELQGKMKPK